LRQGMTASVTITTARKDDALRVPNAALRWTPEDAALQEIMPQRQGVPPHARTASAASRGARDAAKQAGRAARGYKVENGRPVPVFVRVGFSDGQRTELIAGLADGDRVIVGGGESGASGARRRGPF